MHLPWRRSLWIWCDSVRVGAPIWWSHTSRRGRAGRCTYMVKPPGFFFPPHSPLEPVHLYDKAILKNGGAVLLYSWVCGMITLKQRGGWEGVFPVFTFLGNP